MGWMARPIPRDPDLPLLLLLLFLCSAEMLAHAGFAGLCHLPMDLADIAGGVCFECQIGRPWETNLSAGQEVPVGQI